MGRHTKSPKLANDNNNTYHHSNTKPDNNNNYHRSHTKAVYYETLSKTEPKRFDENKLTTELPTWEIRVYIFYIIFCFLYGAWELIIFSNDYQHDDKVNRHLVPGWKIFGRLQDHSDYEWNDLWRNLYTKLFTFAAIHIITSLLVSRYFFQYRRHTWLAVGISAMLYIIGWKYVVLVMVIVMSLFCAALSGSVTITWIIGLLWLGLMNSTYTHLTLYIIDLNHPDWLVSYRILYFTVAFLLLRSISFSYEKAKRVNESSELSANVTFTVFDAVVYAFYFPNYFTGPVFIYKYFQPEIIKPQTLWTRREIMHIAQKTARSIFWLFFIETFLHFIYVHSFGEQHETLQRLPEFALSSMIKYSSTIYQTKYVVTYGLAVCVMMTDRIVGPSNPNCCVRTTFFSNCWRFIDPGLHGFFRNYVYIPLGGSHHGRLRQIFATMASFGFVCLWHGAQWPVLVWTIVNCVAILIEISAALFVRIPAVANFEMRYLSPTMTRRIHAALNVPLLSLSFYALMCFYMGAENGWVFVDRLVIKGSILYKVHVCLDLYAMTIFSGEVERWEYQRQQKVKVQ